MKQKNRLHAKEVSYGVCDLLTIIKEMKAKQPPEVTELAQGTLVNAFCREAYRYTDHYRAKEDGLAKQQ